MPQVLKLADCLELGFGLGVRFVLDLLYLRLLKPYHGLNEVTMARFGALELTEFAVLLLQQRENLCEIDARENLKLSRLRL